MFESFDNPTKEKSKKGKGRQKATKSDDDDAFNMSEIEESDGQDSSSAPASDDLDIRAADQLGKPKKKSRFIDDKTVDRDPPKLVVLLLRSHMTDSCGQRRSKVWLVWGRTHQPPLFFDGELGESCRIPQDSHDHGQ